MDKAKGIVAAVRKDKKGVQLADGNWYSNKFLKGTVECNKGDEVEVEFDINGEYKNLTKLTVTKKSTVQQEVRQDTTKSQMTSYAKDLLIAKIQKIAAIPTDAEYKALAAGSAEEILTIYKKIDSGMAAKEEKKPEQKQDPEEDQGY